MRSPVRVRAAGGGRGKGGKRRGRKQSGRAKGKERDASGTEKDLDLVMCWRCHLKRH